MLSNFNFFISEALIGMRRSGLMTLITVMTVTVSLLVFGFFILISLNMNSLASSFASRLEMRVYLSSNVTQGEINQVQARFQNLPGVKSVKFLDKQEAWTKFKKNYRDLSLNTIIDTNPLPHSFRLTLLPEQDIERLANYIRTFKGYVEDVSYHDVLAKRVILFSTFARIAGFILVGLLTIATLLIIMNTIRLTIIARKDEVTIMKLVGATHAFIKGPFLIEGIMIGAIGSLLSMGILKYGYGIFYSKVTLSLPYFPLVSQELMINGVFGLLILVGTGLGLVGAYFSISRTLKSII